jgi:predicted glycosyltransferase/peptidoglycan/xylan/chitin deacetylase (PgdA/CDA1 family)
MTRHPLDHVVNFWKPIIEPSELERLARYAPPELRPEPGINAWTPGGQAAPYVALQGETRFSLFAAVHPIPDVPDGAEALVDIQDDAGEHHSYVLWFPSSRSVIVPFDPNAAIEAFWYEKHVPRTKRTALPGAVLSFYYSVLKSLLHPRVKLPLRRAVARRAYSGRRFLEWPADDSLDRLQRLLLGLLLLASGRQELEFGWFWPDGKPWAVTLTHDVETAAGLEHAEEVASLEVAHEVRSSFNLVAVDYAISERIVAGLADAGFEIGVHGYTHDGMLFSSRRTFTERLPVINDFGRKMNASGFRSPSTYRNLEWFDSLEFDYDSSVADTAPFEPQPGGCGSLFPYSVHGGLIELPVTLPQDHTLFGLLGESTAQTWLAKLSQIQRSHGMACVLTHPDPAGGYVGLPKNRRHYDVLLDRIVVSGAWTPLPRELARWWRARALTPAQEIEQMAGGALGTVVLRKFGHVDIAPPPGEQSAVAAPEVSPTRAGPPLRVWIDMANSPHVQFFRPIIAELEARGHAVVITARDYAQTVELLDCAGLEYTTIGHHGGRSTIGKLVAIEGRARGLASHARAAGVNIAVHHNSYAQSLAARSLRIPSLTLMDYEYQPANHVSFRLSDVVLVPESIPRRALAVYGAGWRLRRYPGLKEDFYVSSMVNEGAHELDIEGLDPELPLIVLRPPPDLAMYHRLENSLWAPMLQYLAQQGGAEILVVPRTQEQAERLAKQGADRVRIADRAIPPATLLLHADGVITAGGTMAREAAALGIPAYTVFAGRQGGVDASLIRAGRLVEITSADDFPRISLMKCERQVTAGVAAEHERVSWLVDTIVELAGG